MSDEMQAPRARHSSRATDAGGVGTLERLALVFPGQGSQFVGMGRDIYASSPAGRAVFDEADRILRFPISQLCFDGPEKELEDTINVQPAILTVSVAGLQALYERLEAAGTRLEPLYVAGHSLGEYAALVAAGALDFPDALRLVRERGRLMRETGEKRPGGMAAVIGLDVAALERVVTCAREAGEVVLANLNGPAQTVLSGELKAVQRAIELARAEGARRVAMLRVSIASHSPLMYRAAQGLGEALAHVPLRDPEIPVVANITGQVLHTADEIRRELVENVVKPVNWTRSVLEMVNGGGRTFVEVGPGKVLSGLIQRISNDVRAVNVQEVIAERLPRGSAGARDAAPAKRPISTRRGQRKP
jgi:[acyl-carrier-protein] S-malonyltransferase